jgi:hypothetical protein
MSASQFASNTHAGNLIGRLCEQIITGLKAQPRLVAEAFSTELGLTFLGIAAAMGGIVLLFWSRSSAVRTRWIAWPIILATLLGNTLFGQNARARFLMPAYASGAMLAGAGIAIAGAPGAAVAVSVSLLNGVGTWQRVRRNQGFPTKQRLII